MSSAVSSLKGTKRSPLPPLSRNSQHGDIRSASSLGNLDMRSIRDSSVLDSITQRSIVDELRKTRGGNLPSVQKKRVTGPALRPSTMNGDSDLVASMAGRLTMVERELLVAKREVLEKDQKIIHLQEKVKLLEKVAHHSESESEAVKDLKARCLEYQKQVEEMEDFLSDYGMIWVGREGNEQADSEGSLSDRKSSWNPRESVAGDDSCRVNFDVIVKNIQELNVLTGDGELQVASSGQEAALKPVDPIPLALYKNGFAMFSGPFRSYSDSINHQFIRDLTDGYFPSELKTRYPKGVPFLLKDLREKMYVHTNHSIFNGSGHRLGGVVCSSRLLPSTPPPSNPSAIKPKPPYITTSELPVKPMSLDSFLRKLPSNVVKDGRLISVRQDIQQTLLSSSESSKDDKLTSSKSPQPHSSPEEDVCTLRVKSEHGDNAYVVKMTYSSTVGELKQHLHKMRPHNACTEYILRCNYPKKTLDDDDTTLYQIGLYSSANLFIEPKQAT